MIRKGSGYPLVAPHIMPSDIADAKRISNRDASQAQPMFDATEMPEDEQQGPIPDSDHGA